MCAFLLGLFMPLLAAAKATPQSCLLQTSQDRSLLQSQQPAGDAVPQEARDISASEDDDGAQDAASNFKQILEDMEAMASVTGNRTGQTSELSTALQTLMAKFDKVVVGKFKKAFNKTQSQITQNVEELEKTHKSAKNAKAAADDANVDLGKCREKERAKRNTYKQCAEESNWTNKTWDEACQAAADAKFYDWEIDNKLKKQQSCDLSEPSCMNLDELIGRASELNRTASEKRAEYEVKKQQCNMTYGDALEKARDCSQKLSDFLSQKAECDSDETNTDVLMCAFGHRLQEHCNQLDTTVNYNDNVRKGTGTAISETDRQRNWEKAQVMKCQLTSYTKGGDVDKTVKELCEGDVNYVRDVGVMDYLGNRTLSLLQPAPPSFTCTESVIEFAGPNYVAGNVSAKYVSNEKTKHNVTMTPLGAGPFEFCASNSSRISCRSFACPVGWAPRSGNASSTCVLKPCSKHECCVNSNTATVSKPAAKNASLLNVGTDSLQWMGHVVASNTSPPSSTETAAKEDATSLAAEMVSLSSTVAGTPPRTQGDAPASDAKEAAGPPFGSAQEVANATNAAFVETMPSVGDATLTTMGDAVETLAGGTVASQAIPPEFVRTDPTAPTGDVQEVVSG